MDSQVLYTIQQACNGGKGGDMFIHAMICSLKILVMKSLGFTSPDFSVPGFSQSVAALGARSGRE